MRKQRPDNVRHCSFCSSRTVCFSPQRSRIPSPSGRSGNECSQRDILQLTANRLHLFRARTVPFVPPIGQHGTRQAFKRPTVTIFSASRHRHDPRTCTPTTMRQPLARHNPFCNTHQQTGRDFFLSNTLLLSGKRPYRLPITRITSIAPHRRCRIIQHGEMHAITSGTVRPRFAHVLRHICNGLLQISDHPINLTGSPNLVAFALVSPVHALVHRPHRQRHASNDVPRITSRHKIRGTEPEQCMNVQRAALLPFEYFGESHIGVVFSQKSQGRIPQFPDMVIKRDLPVVRISCDIQRHSPKIDILDSVVVRAASAFLSFVTLWHDVTSAE